MLLKFTKMHGCGNDYIYIDCFKYEINNPNELSVKLSDRRYGIGSDGIILICPSDIADAKMRMFNLDGTEGKMCGNGIRCMGKYVYDIGLAKSEKIKIETMSGIRNLELCKSDKNISELRVDMGKPDFNPKHIPVLVSDENCLIDFAVDIFGENYNINCISMGNPHCVLFYDNIDSMDIKSIGINFEKSELFPEGVNTEFVEIIDRNTIKMRVWERGSGETLACGTGACASVVAAVENGFCDKNTDVKVHLLGGDLIVNYTDEAVYMTGNAVKVFEGEIEI